MYTSALLYVSVITLAVYTIVFVRLRIAWKHLQQPIDVTTSSLPFVSVVVPCRNDADSLQKTLLLLSEQDYSRDLFEVIVVNDHSEDDSKTIAEKFSQLYEHFTVLSLKETAGKKQAIAEGISVSKGPLIVTIDADVEIQKGWLSAIAASYISSNAAMLILPVRLTDDSSIFSKMQVIEFASLMATTASTAALKIPIMCNGANLAFRKEDYLPAKSCLQTNVSSGDDMFLLFEFKKKNAVIHWVHHPEVVASTSSSTGIAAFANQRIRWSSKAIHFNDFHTIGFGLLVLLINILLLLNLHAVVFIHHNTMLLICMFVAKAVVDFVFIAPVARWFQSGRSLMVFPLLALAYPFYAVLIPTAGIFYRPKWKGRKINLSAEKEN